MSSSSIASIPSNTAEESIPTRPSDPPFLTMREPLDLEIGTESNPIVIGDDPGPPGTESNPIVIGDDIASSDPAFGNVVNYVNEDIQAEQPRLQLSRLQLLRLQLPRLQVPQLQVPPANELRAYQFKLEQISEQLAGQLQADTERQAEDLESDTETEIMTTPDYWENLIDEDVPISADGDFITETYPILAPPESSVHKNLEGHYTRAGPPAHSLNLDHKLSEPTTSESLMKCRYVGKETQSEIFSQGQRVKLPSTYHRDSLEVEESTTASTTNEVSSVIGETVSTDSPVHGHGPYMPSKTRSMKRKIPHDRRSPSSERPRSKR